MASIAGLIDPEPAAIAASERWSSALSHSASRSGESVRQSVGAPLLAAYRGDAGGCFEGADRTVMLDGWIDNLRELAASTPGSGAGATGDAELVGRLFARHGAPIFERLTGSFALALFERATGEVTLVRDRFGSKPLFFAATARGWAWASEVKSLCPLLDRVSLDPEGLRQAIHYRYTLGETLIEGIGHVLPACIVQLSLDRTPVETQYWKLEFRPSQDDDAIDARVDRVDAALDAHFARLRERYGDVAVLLSGGVDSSLLAVKAARAGFSNCVALTARWPGENPELEWAVAVARHIGIEHRIVDIDESSFEALFPWLIWRLEEPPRHYSSFVLADLLKVASENAELLVHGHAADMFFGMQEINVIETYRRRRSQLSFLPWPLRSALAALLPDGRGARVTRWKRYLGLDEHAFLNSLIRIDYGRLGAGVFGPCLRSTDQSRRALERFLDPREPPAERFQRLDLYTFLQSHFVVLDRLSTPLGLSVVMPFLARELRDIAVELPLRFKVEGGVAKPVLKRLAARYFPSEWIYRAKQGFPTQNARWLRGPLHSWTGLLSDERTAERRVLNLEPLRRVDVDRDFEAVWTAMCLEMFCRQFIDGEAGPPPPRAVPRTQGFEVDVPAES